MAGHATDGGNRLSLLILVEGKIFLIDLAGHLVHMTGDVLLRLRIAGEIQPVGGAVGRRGVTEITFYAKRGLPAVHYLVQVIMADVLGQHFEIVLGFRILPGADGGHSDDHKAKQRGDDGDFLVMQHGGNEILDALI